MGEKPNRSVKSMGDGPNRTVKSVVNACAIINSLRRTGGGTVSEIAENVELSPGSIHTHLATLKEMGLVVQHGDNYDLGPELLAIGEYVRNHSELYQASKRQVDRLAAETGECSHLVFEHEGRLYTLYEQFGNDAVGIEFHDRKREEAPEHLHCTAAGKAILAYLPEDRLAAVLDTDELPSVTAATVTDPEELREELETVREEGVAFADSEQIQGIRAVASPILQSDGAVAGAIAVSGPASRLRDDHYRSEIPQQLMKAANICEVNLQTADFASRSG
jgi:DNA-binding IclR family transcriptional regulator